MTEESLFPALLLLAVLGIAWSIRARHWMILPVWLAVMIPLDPREFNTDMLLPVSLLIGIGTAEVLLPWLANVDWLRSARWSRRIAPSVALFALLYLGVGLAAACVRIDVPLSAGDRAAMTWTMKDTPADSRFLVISGSSQWWTDRQSEWFPALADRVSVATVQGTEWLTTKPFSDHVSEYNTVQRCAEQTAACLDAWSAKTDTSFDYVYVSKTVPIQASYGVEDSRVDKPLESVLDLALRSDQRYSLVFENASAAIYKRN